MANMLNNDNFEHWTDKPKVSRIKMIWLINGVLLGGIFLTFIVIKSVELFVINPTVQVYDDVTQKIDKNVQTISNAVVSLGKDAKEAAGTITSSIDSVKQISSRSAGQIKPIVLDEKIMKEQKKLSSAQCRFWQENDKDQPTERTKAEIAKYCGV